MPTVRSCYAIVHLTRQPCTVQALSAALVFEARCGPLFADRASFASVVMVRHALHASRNEISGGKMANVTQADDYQNIGLDFDKAHVDQDAKVIRMG